MPQIIGKNKHVLFSYSIADSESGEVLEQIGVPIPYIHGGAQRLYQLAQDLDQESADTQGIRLILPLCEELLTYFPDQSIDLGEAIILEMDMGPGTPQTYINLMNLKLN